MKKKQAIAFLLSTTMAVGGAVQAFAASSDISGHWAEATIAKWQTAGKIGGYEDGTFKPDKTITRAEFVRLLNTATATSFTASASINFSDVKESDWFFADVAKAVGSKITSGFEDGTFRPGETVTRAQAAVFICNARGLAPNESAANTFADAAQIPTWAKGAVGAVVTSGYMSGYPDGTFGASKGMTRAEAVSTLDRFSGSGTTTPAPDNQGVSTPDTDKENTTIAEATKQEGNMVWRSGGGGGGSKKGSNDSSNSGGDEEESITISSQSDANKRRGQTISKKTDIYLNSDLNLEGITFENEVTIHSDTVAAAYEGADVAVLPASSNLKWTITLVKDTSFNSNVTVRSDKTDARLVEIRTDTKKEISNFIARTAARIVGFTTTKVQASAPIHVENGSVETVTAEKGAEIVVDSGATINKVDVSGNASVTVKDGAKVKNVAVSGSATAEIALEGSAKVTEVVISDSATAKVDVAKDATVDKITSTSDGSNGKTEIAGAGTVSKVEATDKTTVDVSGVTNPNPPVVEDISGGGEKPEEVLVEKIEIVVADGGEAKIKKGETLKLKANVTPTNATNQTVKWGIKTDGSMAEIDGDGVLKLKDAATAGLKITVTATAQDGSDISSEFTVQVVEDEEPPVTEKVVESVAVKTQPTKLSYKAGEKLDLTGLVITVTYEDKTTKDIAFADFETNKVTTNPGNGIVLASSNNEKPVTITVGGKTADTDNLTVTAAATNEEKLAVDKALIEEGTYEIPVENQTDGETKKAWVKAEAEKLIKEGTKITNVTIGADGAKWTLALTNDTITADNVQAATGTAEITVTLATEAPAAPAAPTGITSEVGSSVGETTINGLSADKTYQYILSETDTAPEESAWASAETITGKTTETITGATGKAYMFIRFAADSTTTPETPASQALKIALNVKADESGAPAAPTGITSEVGSSVGETTINGLSADKTYQYILSETDTAPEESAWASAETITGKTTETITGATGKAYMFIRFAADSTTTPETPASQALKVELKVKAEDIAVTAAIEAPTPALTASTAGTFTITLTPTEASEGTTTTAEEGGVTATITMTGPDGTKADITLNGDVTYTDSDKKIVVTVADNSFTTTGTYTLSNVEIEGYNVTVSESANTIEVGEKQTNTSSAEEEQ